jgi:hypothetical protein
MYFALNIGQHPETSCHQFRRIIDAAALPAPHSSYQEGATMHRWQDPQFRTNLVVAVLAILGSLLMWWSLGRVLPKWYDWPRLWVAGQQATARVDDTYSERYGKYNRYTRYTVTYSFRAAGQDASAPDVTATRRVRRALYQELQGATTVTIWYDPANPERSNIVGNVITEPLGPLLFCLVIGVHGMMAAALIGMGIERLRARFRQRRSRHGTGARRVP